MEAHEGGCVDHCSRLGGQRCSFAAPKGQDEVLMFPDAYDNHWGRFLTQVPTAELRDSVEVEKKSHGPLGFLSGTFRGSQ